MGKRKSFWIGALFAQIGEKDKAFEVLNEMHKRRAIGLILAAREPLLDPLRDDPRFNAIFAQMNLFRLPLQAASFDVVICLGVLHHTDDPHDGIR